MRIVLVLYDNIKMRNFIYKKYIFFLFVEVGLGIILHYEKIGST
jgi:hypothetical protein